VIRKNILSEDQESELNESLAETVNGWADMVVYEDTPFRKSDEVVLLSYGFKYSTTGEGMQKVQMDGTTWYVNITKTVPTWFKNGKKLGALSYDTVVNLFGRNKNGV
jgi:hypothetical protein